MTGILLSRVLLLPWVWMLGLGWFASLLFLARPAWRRLLLMPLLILAGWVHATLGNQALAACDLRHLLMDEPVEVGVRGHLRGPLILEPLPDQPRMSRVRGWLEVAQIRIERGPWAPARGRVRLTGHGRIRTESLAGAAVEFTGVARPPEGAAVPGHFDARRYLALRRIHHEVWLDAMSGWRAWEGGHPRRGVGLGLAGWGAWGRETLSRGLPVVDEPVRLLWAMLLGWREGLRGETGEPFMRSGTMHLFAISGLHVGLIGEVLAGLLMLGGWTRRRSGLLAMPLLWLYAGATGWQPSAVRSTIMMTVLMAGRVVARPGWPLNSLAVAAGVILLWDPNQLFHVGYQLSFVVVLALILVRPLLDAAYRVTMLPSPLQPRLIPGDRPGFWRWLGHWVWKSCLISLSAWLASMPLVATHFHYFSPVSVVANLVLVPLAGLALVSGLASLMVGGWWESLSILFNHSAWFWMMAMQRLANWVAAWPVGAWHVSGPSPAVLLAYYGCLLSVACLLQGGSPRRRAGFHLGLTALAVALFQAWMERPVARLTVLARGGGQMMHVEEDRQGLIDTGDEATARGWMERYLRARGVDRLDWVVLTHGDKRHVEGAWTILEKWKVSRVLASALRFRSPTYRALIKKIEQTGRLSRLEAGQTLQKWRVLHPARNEGTTRADDGAMVLIRELHGKRFLFVGDLGVEGQNRLLNRHPDLQAEVVIAGLPADGHGLANGFLERVRPDIVVVADATWPARERAGPTLRDRLARHAVQVYYVSECGAVVFCLGRNGWQVRSQRSVAAGRR